MAENLEIEFKTMLSQTEYQQLIAHYQLTANDFKTQTNSYFDTPDFQLKAKNCGLRIRRYEASAEYTLKTPAVSGLLETTDTLTRACADAILQSNVLPITGHVFEKLIELGIHSSQLIKTGELTTKRAEFHIKEGFLAIDQSWAENLHDYELELEVQDTTTTSADFLQFLDSFNLPYRPAKNKISRMIEAKN
ncbi:CYTH domain-containing protein [Candidatus Enterococcus courvalinii]|uniref:CYTH domain-containing protein n=1 Tax=Candidatus Enterococcus courvalinii TaxID=2815329 RepID=A0ABS3HY40_9ENTE|nr:CYTH domain-containing protein [Enterococcus sp. MSG2901]MBO0480837.1 CYTH domain-containing protein [Enterococcus sp. MSG2901]